MLSRQRASNAAGEQKLDQLLAGADQSMANAFTGGFRVSQTKMAIGKHLPEQAAAAALESAQIVALAILVREQMDSAQFAAVYRPFATVLPSPGYEPPPPIDRQIAVFMQKLPGLTGPAKDEVMAVAKVLAEAPKPVGPPGAAAAAAAAAAAVAPVGGVEQTIAALYSAAWKVAIDTAHSSGRTISFRASQDLAEQAAPHDGSGIVGNAGVAAGAIFMRDLLPVEQVLLLYEPFAAAFPYESLR